MLGVITSHDHGVITGHHEIITKSLRCDHDSTGFSRPHLCNGRLVGIVGRDIEEVGAPRVVLRVHVLAQRRPPLVDLVPLFSMCGLLPSLIGWKGRNYLWHSELNKAPGWNGMAQAKSPALHVLAQPRPPLCLLSLLSVCPRHSACRVSLSCMVFH